MSNKVPSRQHAVNVRSAAGDALSELYVAVLRLHAAFNELGDELASAAGQTAARWQVLAAVENGDKAVSHLARLLGLARQSVQRVADLLVAEGLCTYEDNPDHLRAKLLHLAPHGAKALTTIQTRQRRWADRVGSELGERELKKASAILARVLRSARSDTRTAGTSSRWSTDR
jgi:DNA-binding MarR family transcriptional regulator